MVSWSVLDKIHDSHSHALLWSPAFPRQVAMEPRRLPLPALWAATILVISSNVTAFIVSSASIVRLGRVRFNLLRPSSSKDQYHEHQHSRQGCPGRRACVTAPAMMSSLRTFEPGELQLQRFIGELGFVEITDWCVKYKKYMREGRASTAVLQNGNMYIALGLGYRVSAPSCLCRTDYCTDCCTQ